MKIRKILALAAAAIAGCMAISSASAVVSIPYGWYAEANVGSSQANNTNYPGSGLSTGGTAYNANIGYKFMPFFAAEIGYSRYASLRIQDASSITVAKDYRYSYDIAGRGILPISDSGFELFAKLGLARLITKLSVTNPTQAAIDGLAFNSGHSNVTGVYFGLGADYTFTPNIQVNGQWNRAKGNNTTGNSDLYSLGVTFMAA